MTLIRILLFLFFITTTVTLLVNSVDSLNIQNRIYTGTNSSDGDYPFQLLLSIVKTDLFKYLCGGILLTDRWFLTAGHCANNAVTIDVKLGALSYSNNSEIGIARLNGSNCIIHPDYNFTTDSDIALCRLNKKPPLSYKIKMATLPNEDDLYEYRWAVTSGWGLQNSTLKTPASTLLFGDLIIIPNADAATVYGSIITPSIICGRGPNYQSTCKGDSGGPLTVEPSYTLIGITSFGPNSGCDQGLPCCFTRISSFIPWILYNTGIVLNKTNG